MFWFLSGGRNFDFSACRYQPLVNTMDCTLCSGLAITPLLVKGDAREYFKCESCQLVFVDPRYHLTKEEERERYLKHNNGIENTGYVNFLNRIVQPCMNFMQGNMIGLDYGCGPVPTLSKLLSQQGIQCHDYDPLFKPEHLHSLYDFIFATECFEHFFYPASDFLKINNLLKPGGFLAIMTEQWQTVEQFKAWYYRKDPTHVSFYHKNTFAYLCEEFNYAIHYQDQNRIVVLQKNDFSKLNVQ